MHRFLWLAVLILTCSPALNPNTRIARAQDPSGVPWPDGWDLFLEDGTNSTVIWDSTLAHAGDRSIMMLDREGWVVISSNSLISYDPDQEYTCSARFKTMGPDFSSKLVKFDFFDADWKWLGDKRSSPAETALTWSQQSVSAQPDEIPNGTAYIQVSVSISAGKEAVWVDDIRLTTASETLNSNPGLE